jgi:hypothetical protein
MLLKMRVFLLIDVTDWVMWFLDLALYGSSIAQ